jgi:hypothetical protein
MGRGEGYYLTFCSWFSGLSPADQAEYMSAHKPPRGWKGFYDQIIRNPRNFFDV